MLTTTVVSLVLLAWAILFLLHDARRRSRRMPLLRRVEHLGGNLAEEAEAWLRRQR